MSITQVYAQRQQPRLGRGVVAVKNGSSALVTWRRLAQEPEDAQYNVYVNGTKLNASPLKNTNYSTTAANLPADQQAALERYLGVAHYPTYILFDPQGRRIPGPEPRPHDIEGLKKKIEGIIGGE